MFFSRNRRLSVVNLVILLTMLGGLLLGACGQADIGIDLNFDEGGDNQDGMGNLSETSLFVLMIVLFLTMVALVAVAGRG